MTGIISLAFANPTIALGIAVALSAIFIVRYLSSPWRKLPPGPRGLPILGSALDLRVRPWLKFNEWRAKYGDVFYLNAAGAPVVVVNSQKTAGDILERRATNYSDRARNVVAYNYLTRGMILLLQNYGPLWRRMRKASHEGLHNKEIEEYIKHHGINEALILTLGLLQEPSEWDSHMRRASVSLIMSTVYGTSPIPAKDDPGVKGINDFIERLAVACLPGSFLVEFFPWMKYIPSRLATWKREAQEWFLKDSVVFDGLFQHVKAERAAGVDRATFGSLLLRDSDRYKLTQAETSWLAAQMFAAGSDTTSATLAWGFLAILAHPEVQKRAQEELDSVVGRTRIPTAADIPSLPYIRAILREMMRWRPVGPAGLPHASTDDDWYEGKFIPAGTIIIPNVWAINHDASTYGPDVAQFKPERHMNDKGELAPAAPETKGEGHVGYGFGRRVCVGKEMANTSLEIDLTIMLWACSFEREKDAQGRLIPLELDDCVDDGLVARPIPFKCRITPRFPDVLHLLQEERELRLPSA